MNDFTASVKGDLNWRHSLNAPLGCRLRVMPDTINRGLKVTQEGAELDVIGVEKLGLAVLDFRPVLLSVALLQARHLPGAWEESGAVGGRSGFRSEKSLASGNWLLADIGEL